MAMDKYELIDFQLGLVPEGLDVGRQPGKMPVLVLNVSIGFDCNLLRALYLLREGKPVGDAFDRAIDFVVDHRDEVEDITEIPVSRVNILCFLADRPKLVVERVTFPVVEMRLDYLLGEALFGDEVGSEWDDHLTTIELDKRQQLMVQTYRNYLDLLQALGGPQEKIEELLARGEELFRKRRNDEFYSGGPETEGGCLDNDLTVDYRLLALKKAAGLPV